MLNVIKKVVLFLFGIVLVVFGNRAAINTIFKDNDIKDDTIPDVNESEVKEIAPIEEVIPQAGPSSPIPAEEKPVQNNAVSPKIKKNEPARKTEAEPKTTKVKAISEEKISEEEVVVEKPVTKIEPEKSESASGSE